MLPLVKLVVTRDALAGVFAALRELTDIEGDLAQDAMTMHELVLRMRPCRHIQARSTMLQSFIEFAMDVEGRGKTQMGYEPFVRTIQVRRKFQYSGPVALISWAE